MNVAGAEEGALRILNADPNAEVCPLTPEDLTDASFVEEMIDCARCQRRQALLESGWVETRESEEQGGLVRALLFLLGRAKEFSVPYTARDD